VKFCHDLSRNFIYEKCLQRLSFLLVTHMTCFDIRFGCYGILKLGSSFGQILDRMDRGVEFSSLRPKKRESWRGLITDSVGHLLILSTPTQSHNFTNHSNGYDCLSTAHVRSSVDCWKSDSSTVSKLGFDFIIYENYDL
jgi:hypothetical protein